ncbi:MAG: thioredoxin-disulfide reductase [Patescibacteria group bacterium]
MEETIEFAPKPKEGEPWDVAIIGSGPAGLTAAIYTTRGAASTLILGGEKWGGQLMLTTEVDNFPAHPGIQGPELMLKMRDHATRFGGEFVEKNVESVDFTKYPFELTASDRKYLAKTVIIATGADTRWLGIPGEDKLRGRGVSSCAPCDAPFFKNKNVAVIGGGDAAMEEALVLTKYATSVTIIHRRDAFKASAAMQKKVFDLEKQGKIKIMWDASPVEFVGDKKLEKVKLKNTKTEESSEMLFDGAFVAIGHIPSTKVFGDRLELDAKGYVVVHDHTGTNIAGVYVAGDVHDYHYRQAVTAAGFGCMAALDTLKFLDDQRTKKV